MVNGIVFIVGILFLILGVLLSIKERIGAEGQRAQPVVISQYRIWVLWAAPKLKYYRGNLAEGKVLAATEDRAGMSQWGQKMAREAPADSEESRTFAAPLAYAGYDRVKEEFESALKELGVAGIALARAANTGESISQEAWLKATEKATGHLENAAAFWPK